jgi:hypothetical protein
LDHAFDQDATNDRELVEHVSGNCRGEVNVSTR